METTAAIVLFGLLALISLALLGGLLYLAYFILSLPMRRAERARLFLDLVETGLKQGQSAERTIVGVAESHDRAPGMRFYLLAAHLENGLRLGAALDRVPRLLPPRMAAMLKAGEAMGDVGKVLPACRALLKDGVSQVWAAIHYLPVLLLAGLPLTLWVVIVLQVFILPKYFEIASGMEAPLPAGLLFLVEYSNWIRGALLGMCGFMLLLVFFYVGGPRALSRLRLPLDALTDQVTYRLPWQRKRMHRDFAGILALLLDSGVPEERALTLAASSTANSVMVRRASKVKEELRHGKRLTEAIARLDDSGEFKWRLANAAQGAGRFWNALAGWRETLDAKAFREEQTVSHLVSSMLILTHGLIVGLVVTGVFIFLIGIIEGGLLW